MTGGHGAPGQGVDVVIPYYRDQPMLDRILAALEAQAGLEQFGVAGGLRVIVADDGSPEPPRVPPDVTVVRQADEGFRASAARHLGAAAGSGEILLFLDGDTVPGPGYVAAMLRELAGHPDLLVVGRRRYGRFADTGTPAAAGTCADTATCTETVTSAAGFVIAEELPDPPWPASFYAETADLTRGDDLWRGVLSAVCGLHRRLYDLAGGFDPDIVGYGGEDWDLAWRCEQAGGRLLHVPGAVAWHDGPDWSGRAASRDAHHAVSAEAGPAAEHADKNAEKNAETARLAPRIASPLARPAGGIFTLPQIAVRVHAAGPEFAGSGTTAATVTSVLTWSDVSVWVDAASADAGLIGELFAADPRVSVGPAPGPGMNWQQPLPPGGAVGGPRRRPPVLVDIHRPCALGGLDARRLRALCPPAGALALHDPDGHPLATVRTSRALAREQEWGEQPPETTAVAASTLGVEEVGEPGQSIRLEGFLSGW